MKTYFLIFLLVLFCGVHTYVVILLSSYSYEPRIVSLMTHVPLLLFLGTLYLTESIGFNSAHDRQFHSIGKMIIFVFLLMYCLNSLGWVSGVTRKLFWFYGINLVGLLMILISSYRHGNFKS